MGQQSVTAAAAGGLTAPVIRQTKSAWIQTSINYGVWDGRPATIITFTRYYQGATQVNSFQMVQNPDGSYAFYGDVSPDPWNVIQGLHNMLLHLSAEGWAYVPWD